MKPHRAFVVASAGSAAFGVEVNGTSQRGNQREEMLAHGATSVLIYDSELVMRGDELPHPVNYSLLAGFMPGEQLEGGDVWPKPLLT